MQKQTDSDFVPLASEAPSAEPASSVAGLNQQQDPAALAADDFYYEGPYLVFTAAYHLKRGFCCNSGCRHCPYR